MALKIILIILTSLGGYFLGDKLFLMTHGCLWGLGGGALLGAAIIILAKKMEKIASWIILAGIGGLIIGLVIANLFTYIFLTHSAQPPEIINYFSLLLNVVFGYLGLVVGVKKVREMDLSRLQSFASFP